MTKQWATEYMEAYKGLSKIWTGEMTFDKAVEHKLLRKSEM